MLLKYFIITTTLLGIFGYIPAQDIKGRLEKAMIQLQQDDQFKHAILSLYVVDAKTGEVIFAKNEQAGLAAASCQKVVTSVAAFEFLKKDFTYKTSVTYQGEIQNNTLTGSLYFEGTGDPTIGSWRWKQTREETVFAKLVSSLTAKGIRKIDGSVVGLTGNWDTNNTPNGWTWEDMGNYYGAGVSGLNWHENQYDLVFKAGRIAGDKTNLVSLKPAPVGVTLINELRTGNKGSGDNAYVYLPAYSNKGYIRGTIPAGENNFVIAGSFPDPVNQFLSAMVKGVKDGGILFSQEPTIRIENKVLQPITSLFTIQSPSLDSMNYWFLKRSINLYGEAFVKTISYQKVGYGATDSGIAIIKAFWQNRGIDKSALKIIDGSGLSPANRITTNALVTVMQYARKQSWFSSFYEALPLLNGIKMKDGYISGVRGFTGYINSRSTEYTFAFLVNNFDGNAGAVREKMWKVLDLLK